jgi:hypothetical protein
VANKKGTKNNSDIGIATKTDFAYVRAVSPEYCLLDKTSEIRVVNGNAVKKPAIWPFLPESQETKVIKLALIITFKTNDILSLDL